MKTRIGFLFVLILPFLLASCSKQPKVNDITVEEVEEVTMEDLEEVDPFVTEEPMEELPPLVTPTTGMGVFGFRVQVGAFLNQSGADMQAAKARTAFTEHQIYTVYIEPYHKVRVGDFLTRRDAEAVRDQANARGFPGSFLVETTISR